MKKILMLAVLPFLLTACNKEEKIMEDNKQEIEDYLGFPHKFKIEFSNFKFTYVGSENSCKIS